MLIGSGQVLYACDAFTVKGAWHANGMVAVHVHDSVQGFKGRASNLCEHLKGKYSHRERAYIMSPTKAEKLKKLYDDGYDASCITNELRPPRPEPSKKEPAQ